MMALQDLGGDNIQRLYYSPYPDVMLLKKGQIAAAFAIYDIIM